MGKIVVVKFGGSVLSDERSIERAAKWLKGLRDKGLNPVVVVSALRGVTDELLKTAQRLNPEAPPELMDEVLAMGERTSARLFAVALTREGVAALVVDPDSPLWPVITDEKHLDATPILDECRRKASEGLLPEITAGRVPVVCGYIGVSKNGRITTLGRGGSDTTAVLLANCLGAEEVILVKDVGGIHSADPRKTREAEVIETMSASEVLQLTTGGAKVLHAKALRYINDNMRIRVGTLESLEEGGTLITASGMPKLEVATTHDNVTMVTIIGKDMGEPSKLTKMVEALVVADAKLLAASIEENSLIIYLDGDGAVVEKLHDLLVSSRLGKAISHFPNLSMIKVSGTMLETSPGVIHKITQPLAAQAINVYGLVTISSSIRLFVSSKEASKAINLIRDGLREVVDEAA